MTDTDVMYVPLAPEPQPVPRPPRWRTGLARLRPRTLTSKLVTGVVALVVLLVTVTGVATYYSVKNSLEAKLGQQVSSLADDRAAITQYVTGFQTSTASDGPVDVWVTLVEPDGSMPATLGPHTETLHNMIIAPSVALSLYNHPSKQKKLTTQDGVQLLAQATPFTDPDLPNSVIIIGLSTKNVTDTLDGLVIRELLLALGATLFAALLTSWGVRAGLRPLKRVTRTAQEVTAELGPDGTGLERRVPGPEDNTEVGQVASSVNRLLQTVQTEFTARVASEERMRQFLADASHELRTPLTSIRGYAELSRLKGGSTDPDDPLRRIESEGTRMSRLVEDLLVLARGDQDSLTEHEPVLIDVVISEAAAVARSAHPERQITVRASTESVVIGDHDQLVRLLVNLLNNAAIHTAPGGPIFIEGVTGYTESGPAVALRVIDSGPGLLPDEAAHVFERFWRADKARSRVQGGSGLGMAIVAQIVESHGGQVRFDSAVETGTTVTVTLPTAASQTVAAFVDANSVQNLSGTRQN